MPGDFRNSDLDTFTYCTDSNKNLSLSINLLQSLILKSFVFEISKHNTEQIEDQRCKIECSTSIC